MTDRLNGMADSPALVNVDRLLFEFYRAEMPDPWPGLARPTQAPLRLPAQRFARNFFRFALAASVVIAMAVYLRVADMFPKDATPDAAIIGTEIGKLPGHRPPLKHLSPVENIHTPSGIDAQLFEEPLPDGGQVINIQIVGPSKSKSPR
jgi:hypothetical protein